MFHLDLLVLLYFIYLSEFRTLVCPVILCFIFST